MRNCPPRVFCCIIAPNERPPLLLLFPPIAPCCGPPPRACRSGRVFVSIIPNVYGNYMKSSRIITSSLITAAFCFCAGISLGFLLGRRVQTDVVSAVTMVEIFVAARSIEQGFILDEEILDTISIPESAVTEAMIWDEDAVLGCVAKFEIDKGTPIARWMIHCGGDPLPPPPGSNGR